MKFLGIVRMVNGNDNTLQRSAVYLDVMLVHVSARLTIKVSFDLDKKHTLPQSPSPSPFIHPFPSSPCATRGLALP